MTPIISADDKKSAAYQTGYAQGLKGDDAFRNPCHGNAKATESHYWGFLAGQSERRKLLVCDCQNPEPLSGVALVSEECPVHNIVAARKQDW